MNNRFKFRFWSKTYNCYVDVLDLVGWEVSEKIPVWKNGNLLSMEETKDVIPEQCTGLKDKNGKLIYEGDIVKRSGQAFIVEWRQDRLSFVLSNDENLFESYDITHFEIEVIGNIHEDSDLLESEER